MREGDISRVMFGIANYTKTAPDNAPEGKNDICLVTLMPYDLENGWREKEGPDEYAEFKEEVAMKLIRRAEKYLPGLSPESLGAERVLELRADEDRIEMDRGSITEWFVNTPEGLEHGFTVPARPHGASERVVFDLAFAGGLRAVFAEDGQAIDLYSTDDVAVLRYGKLLVIDAAGDELPARLEPIAGGVRIAVDYSRAVYPLTVDPLATSASWTAAGEAMNNHFGVSVSTAGDVNGDGYSDVLVGADRTNVYRGKAYLYLGTASGLSAAPSWTAAGEAEGNDFGGSKANTGDGCPTSRSTIASAPR